MAGASVRTPFITLEGGEAVGKSTLVRALAAAFQKASLPHLVTFEPGGTQLGQQIRQLFFNPPEGESLDAMTELFLVSAARRHHLCHKILPALEAGQWVLCDRFHDSSRVYQGLIGGLSTEQVESIIATSTDGREPDVTFLLTLTVDKIEDRLRARDASKYEDTNRFDGQSRHFHEKLRAGFLSLADRFPKRIVVLDADRTTDQLVQDIMGKLSGWRNGAT